jgi:hypothetical protein
MLSVVMLHVTDNHSMLSVVMLNVIMLSVIMLSVVAPSFLPRPPTFLSIFHGSVRLVSSGSLGIRALHFLDEKSRFKLFLSLSLTLRTDKLEWLSWREFIA